MSGPTPSGRIGGGGAPIPPGSGEYYRYFHRATRAEIFEDFLGVDVINQRYGESLNFRPVTITAAPMVDVGGVIELGIAAGYFRNDIAMLRASALEEYTVEWRARMYTRPGGQQNVLGVMWDVNNFIGLGISNAGNFRCYSMVTGAMQVNIDTTVAWDNLYHRFKIVVNNVECKWYLDDVLRHTDSNPGVNYRILAIYLGIIHPLSTGSTRADWCYILQTFANPRTP